MGGLAGIHEMLGGLVVVALIVTAILAAVEAARARREVTDGGALRIVSYVAAALLLLQYLLGVLLITSNLRNSVEHYVIALLVLVPVALQHGAGRRLSPQARGVGTLIWALAAAFLAILAYLTGTFGAG
jgi:heme A synthase